MKQSILILLVLLILSVAGCGPAGKLRRAEKLIAKSGLQWKVDTLRIDVPVFIDRIALDTLLISRPSDTVYLSKERLRLKYVKLPGDTVWISAECLADTVYKSVPVTITKVISAPKSKWWRALLIGAGLGIGLCLVLVFAFRR